MQIMKFAMQKMMALALLPLSFVLLSAGIAGASSGIIVGGSDVPFPLDYPLPFPWDTITGVWKVEGRNLNMYFSFEVKADCDKGQILKVLQVNPNSGEIVAEGIGTKHVDASDGSEEVRAAMSSQFGAYMLHVGAYADTRELPYKHTNVLRIVPFDNPEFTRAYVIRKVCDAAWNPQAHSKIYGCQ